MERFSLELPARLSVATESGKQESLELLTSNICAGGAFFETEQPLVAGTEVKIDLVLPLDELKKLEGTRPHIKVSGAVIRTDEKGMAISFDERYQILPFLEWKPWE